MKRLVTWLLLVCVIINMMPTFADKFSEYDYIPLIDQKTLKEESYKTVAIIQGGQDVISDMPGIILGGRTLVPVRVVSESVGATVGWNGSTKEVTIKVGTKTVVLTIDQATAKVNGKSYTLPDKVPAKLMTYQDPETGEVISRTYVPVRFVSEQLGLDVNWVDATKTVLLNKAKQDVTNVSYDKSGQFPEVVIHTTGPVDVSSYYIGGVTGVANKLILDVQNTDFNFKDKLKVSSDGTSFLGIYDVVNGLSSARAYQLKDSILPKTRVEINLDNERGYEIIKESNKIRIQFINTVNDIGTENIKGAETVIIKTGEAPAYDYKEWNGKAIIDIVNSKMKFSHPEGTVVPVNKGGIVSYSYSQHDASAEYGEGAMVSRIVVTLERPELLENVYVDDSGNDIFVYVSSFPLNTFTYGKSDNISTSSLVVEGSKGQAIQSSYEASQKRLTFMVPKAFAYLDDFSMAANDHIVDQINVKLEGDYYVVTVQMTAGSDYKIISNGLGGELRVSFENKALEKLDFKGKLIVIDAGHGGKDPGAISSIDGTKEKDLVLKMAQKLQQQLVALGFKVYMTRDYDVYIGLYERAAIANEIGAHAFVSIHANAAFSTSAKGVEMLYVDDARNSKNLASLVQSETIKTTSATNRGIKERSKLVVIRETNMPAILAEIGFMTNADEMAKLNSDDYLNKLVSGMVNGIKTYLDK